MNLSSASVFLVAVSFVSPTAAVNYADVQANAAYIQPVAKVSYVEVSVQAEVTFPDVYAVDVITPTDLVALTVSKGNQETLATSEYFLGVLTKQLVESSALADSFSSINTYIRDYSDTTVSFDSIALSSQLAKVETVVFSDTNTFAVGKRLTEGIVLIDNMDGDIDFNFVKTTTESLTGIDSYTVAFNKPVSDNTALVSSGVLSMQDYCDITYFLEDYVGLSRSFT